MDLLLRRLLRAAMQRGLGEQNWAWIVIACCAVILRRALRDKGGLVSSVKVAPGEQILISVRDSKSAANAAAPAYDQD